MLLQLGICSSLSHVLRCHHKSFLKCSHSANNGRCYFRVIQVSECFNFNSKVFICSYFLETFLADIVVIWDKDLNQIGCFDDSIHRNYAGFFVDSLMVSLDCEIPQDFRWVIFSYLCWYHGMYFLINPFSSIKRHECIYKRYNGVEIFRRWKTIACRFDVVDVFYLGKADFTCTIIFNIEDMLFLIYLVKIVYSWMETTVNSVAFLG